MFQVLHHLFRHILRNPPVPMRIFVLLGVILLYGTTGFVYFELSENPELSWYDGLWYTVVTMTTVGYGDFFPKSTGGRFLVGWPVMVFGIGLLGYALSVVAAALVTSKSKEIKGMSSFDLKDHLVVFNFPGLGKVERIVDELRLDPSVGKSLQVVLVDEFLEELPPELVKRGIHFVRGNPVRDGTLSRAAIDSVRHAVILCRNPSDPASDNLNVTIALAIEGRNRKANTVVECVDPASEELLRKAGCDRIVCTSRFDAHFLSQELLNPGIQEVMDDLLSASGGQQLYLTAVTREATIAEFAALCREKGHVAIGIHQGKTFHINPSGKTTVAPGDRIITIGPGRLPEL